MHLCPTSGFLLVFRRLLGKPGNQREPLFGVLIEPGIFLSGNGKAT